MATIQEIASGVIVDGQNYQHTGVHRFNGGTAATGFSLVDPTDATKVMIFDLSALSTGTTTTFAPSAGGAEVTENGTQTLTNKTLTNPVINAGSGTVVLPGANPPAQTAEGSAVWDTVNDLLTVGTGSTRKTMLDLDSNQTASGKTFTSPVLNSPTINRTNQQFMINAAGVAKAGATAGWAVAPADNLALITLPQSQTGSTLVIPITGLKVGWIITGCFFTGQIESGGNTVTVDSDFRVMTAVAADFTDASIQAGPSLSVTADTLISSANTNSTFNTPNTVSGVKTYYLLITATTGASCDIGISAVTVICTTN